MCRQEEKSPFFEIPGPGLHPRRQQRGAAPADRLHRSGVELEDAGVLIEVADEEGSG